MANEQWKLIVKRARDVYTLADGDIPICKKQYLVLLDFFEELIPFLGPRATLDQQFSQVLPGMTIGGDPSPTPHDRLEVARRFVQDKEKPVFAAAGAGICNNICLVLDHTNENVDRIASKFRGTLVTIEGGDIF